MSKSKLIMFVVPFQVTELSTSSFDMPITESMLPILPPVTQHYVHCRVPESVSMFSALTVHFSAQTIVSGTLAVMSGVNLQSLQVRKFSAR